MARDTMMIPIPRTCAFCGKKMIIMVDYWDMHDYIKCIPLNEAFPHLTTDKRNTIIYGLCPKCMKKISEEK